MNTLLQRFNDKWVLDPKSGCWNWTASTFKDNGYPQIVDFSSGKRVNRRGNRVAYELFNGPIPSNKSILHSCHNKLCVNPKHLRIGTHQDNMDDKVNASRQVKGEDVFLSVLTEKQVLEIRSKYIPRKYSHQKLADEYGVHVTTIEKIMHRTSWKHI